MTEEQELLDKGPVAIVNGNDDSLIDWYIIALASNRRRFKETLTGNVEASLQWGHAAMVSYLRASRLADLSAQADGYVTTAHLIKLTMLEQLGSIEPWLEIETTLLSIQHLVEQFEGIEEYVAHQAVPAGVVIEEPEGTQRTAWNGFVLGERLREWGPVLSRLGVVPPWLEPWLEAESVDL